MTTPDLSDRRPQRPTSLVDFAADSLRRMILEGRLSPGERVPEPRLSQQLGISRPPLREALRLLAREGLLVQEPRKGVTVTSLTLHDVYEIFTLRREYETLAIRIGVPVRDPRLLARCHDSLARMEAAARADDEVAWAEDAFDFHLSVIGLANHARLEDAYRSLSLQMQLCMTMNRRARVDEDFHGDAERHRRLLTLIETGDPEQVLAELAVHGDRTFLDGIEDRLGGHTEAALTWLRQAREERV